MERSRRLDAFGGDVCSGVCERFNICVRESFITAGITVVLAQITAQTRNHRCFPMKDEPPPIQTIPPTV